MLQAENSLRLTEMSIGDSKNTTDLTGKYIKTNYLLWKSAKQWSRSLGDITERDLKNIHILNACKCSVNAQSTKSSSIFSSICSCSREILREIKTFRILAGGCWAKIENYVSVDFVWKRREADDKLKMIKYIV